MVEGGKICDARSGFRVPGTGAGLRASSYWPPVPGTRHLSPMTEPTTPWSLISLPTHSDPRGSITICESGAQIPFAMQRARWVFGAPANATRGGHAHHRTAQLFVAVAGALTIAVDDGRRTERVRLDTPSRGLLIPPGVWIDTEEFAPDTVLLMLASEPHDPADYIRDRAEFEAAVRRAS